MKKVLVIVIVAIAAAVFWHLHVAGEITAGLEDAFRAELEQGVFVLELNPVTNRAVFTVSGSGAAGQDPEHFDKTLSRLAGERFDVYARVVPYRTRVVHTKDPFFISNGEISSDAELWSAPGSSTALGQLRAGEPLMILSATSGADGKWVQVRTRDRRTGWVRDAHVVRK